MKKVTDFLKSNLIIVKWTIWYFFIIWAILKFIFKFDMFSCHYWWKFFHATLHGFAGFVFGFLVYAAIPVYIATTFIVYRKRTLIIPIPFVDKIYDHVKKLFCVKKIETVDENTNTENIIEPEKNESEYPDDLPPELRIPFQRAKNHLSLTGAISVYNKPATSESTHTNEQKSETESSEIPIPTDFDIGDTFNDLHDSVPTFTDINFNIPIATETKLDNNTTKYFDKHNTEYETYHNFVATEKYLIYEHNDEDFWIMDGDSWFASGKQIDSPINELISTAKQNGLKPIIYLVSENIMDLDGTINNFESLGIHVIKSLDELK